MLTGEKWSTQPRLHCAGIESGISAAMGCGDDAELWPHARAPAVSRADR